LPFRAGPADTALDYFQARHARTKPIEWSDALDDTLPRSGIVRFLAEASSVGRGCDFAG